MPPGTGDARDLARRRPARVEARSAPARRRGRRSPRSPRRCSVAGHDRARPHADRVAPARAGCGSPRSPGPSAPRPRDRRARGRAPAAGSSPAAPRSPGSVVPQLLGDERDHRVRRGDRLAQDVQQRRGERGAVVGIGVVAQARLDDLQVPVAQLAVDEVVEAERDLREVEAVQARLRLGLRRLQAREDPAVLDRARLRPGAGRGVGVVADAQHDEARRVVELVGERLALGDLLLAEAHVLRGGHRQQPEAHGVGAVGGEVAALRERRRPRAALDERQRVDAGAQRLAHPPPVGRLDDRVDVDVLERDVVGEAQPQHHHPRDPQKQDVAPRREHVGRIEGLQARACARASRASRTATARTRTTCRARRGPAPSPRPPAASRRRTSPRRGTRPGSGGPTTAGARCTTGGCSPASRRSAATATRDGS